MRCEILDHGLVTAPFSGRLSQDRMVRLLLLQARRATKPATSLAGQRGDRVSGIGPQGFKIGDNDVPASVQMPIGAAEIALPR